MREIAAWRDLREGRGFSEGLRRAELWAIVELCECYAYYDALLSVFESKAALAFPAFR